MAQDISADNKRIVKNTMMMYVRMVLTMGINLYISRAVLEALGVQDYGIYNVAGGIVHLFTLFSGAMNISTQRYITYALGKGNMHYLKRVFSTSVVIHILLALCIFLLVESIGMWFLYNKLVIPVERLQTAYWVLQCSTLSIMIGIWAMPYNAVIVAHEKMSAFAYLTLLEVLLRLLVVLILPWGGMDRLLLYGILLLAVQAIMRFIYGWYSYRNFEETHNSLFLKKDDIPLFKEIFSFASWNLMSYLAGMFYTQGANILLNVFFGPVVNAARGVAVQVQGAVMQFALYFQTAINPQITKNYAQNNMAQMHNLIFKSSKFTFLLLMILTLPFMCESDFILGVWLVEVPDWSSIFVKIILGIVIINGMSNSLKVAVQSTGEIKRFQIVVSGIEMTILPLTYIAFRMGCNPSSFFVIYLLVSLIASASSLVIVKYALNISYLDFVNTVLVRCLLAGVFSCILPLFLHFWLGKSTLQSLVVIMSSVLSSVVCSYLLGLTNSERSFVNERIKKIVMIKIPKL